MCERELETEPNCNISTPTQLAITAFLSRSPGLFNRGPGGPASLEHVPQSSIFSPTDWTSCVPSYTIVRRPLNLWPTEYATSTVFGMACFDHQRAEITVMQFTGHPLPVHQFVTVPWDFNPVPYCQTSSPTQSLPITGQRNMQLPPSLEWYVWPGRRSI